ncbi:hypothetical protein L218DRAFT_1080352 [Marasmius fiardii PR-910]|nr:hypothetical protein L218DRAFT_1080352 [Marasmius fiardii PR-910]
MLSPPLVFNKDDYPPLDGKLWKDHWERLQEEEDKVDTVIKKIKRVLQDFEDLKEEHKEWEMERRAAFKADLQTHWEMEERKKEQERVVSAVADKEKSAMTDTSSNTLVSGERPGEAEPEEPMKLIADDPVFQMGVQINYQQWVAEEEEGQCCGCLEILPISLHFGSF